MYRLYVVRASVPKAPRPAKVVVLAARRQARLERHDPKLLPPPTRPAA